MIANPSTYLPISDYALIGNTRSAALVSKEGSVDWMCLPRFDSPSTFGAILDAERGGRFRIRPVGLFHVVRQYVHETNALETTFETATGTAMLRDLMSVRDDADRRRAPEPDHELLRELRGISGEVEVEVTYEPRPDYGRLTPKIQERGALGLWVTDDCSSLVLLSDIPLQVSPDHSFAAGRASVHTGERRYLSLSYSANSPAVIPALGDAAAERMQTTVRWWQEWSGRCEYMGPHRSTVVRSVLALKLLAYSPSGALVAAATTSLPERIGGTRNWDYRYCWLRDSSSAIRAFMDLGYNEEAQSFLNWMVHATRLTRPALQIVYDVYGNSHLQESTLDHLDGYASSRPVRIGNAAHGQLQLDVYGEVLAAAYVFANRGGTFDRETAGFLADLGHMVSISWRKPDEGIWEPRSGRVHNTHSKVQCWVALDRLVKLRESGKISASVDKYRAERDAIKWDIEAHGYDAGIGSYVRSYGKREMDASLLVLPIFGYTSASDPRMINTYQHVMETLGRGNLLYRYAAEDGLPPGEGTFGISAFWAVECEALQGRLDAAEERFSALIGYANDVGLYAEEIDEHTGAALGNFPQAFTHIGLINAALTLERVRKEAADRKPQLVAAGAP